MVHRVLLIDDEREWHGRVRTMLARLRCRETGAQVLFFCADNEAKGVEQIESGGWSLLICDLYLIPQRRGRADPSDPEAGLRLVARAEEYRRRTGIQFPILVLTQFSRDQDLVARAMEAGADEVIGKLDRDELDRLIREKLGLAEALRQPAPGDLDAEDGGQDRVELRLWNHWLRLFSHVFPTTGEA